MKNNNTMMCDLETGVCGTAEEEEMEMIDFHPPKKSIQLYYVTDPICSHCWALEPTLRRFMKQYGHYFNFKTVMGGLLEKWHGGPVDPVNGIHGPADVAGHRREVGKHYRMPIDGSLMIDDPVQSSFPPSRVYKMIQTHHGEEKAFEYLRRAREALFIFNKNLGVKSVLAAIVHEMGLDGGKIVKEADEQTGHDLLKEDFVLTRKLGARGFPTIIMVNEENKGVKIVGGRPFEYYIHGLTQVLGEKPVPKQPPALSALLEEEKLLFAKEIEVMYEVEESDLNKWMDKELSPASYQVKEILGELYFTTTTK